MNNKHINAISQSLTPLIFGLLFSTIILVPIFLIYGLDTENPINLLLFSFLEPSLLGIGTLIFIYMVSNSDRFKINYFNLIHTQKIPIKRMVVWTIIAIVGLLIINMILSMIFTLFDLEMAENAIFQIAEDNPIYILYLIPVMILVVGPVEEFLFRGILQGVLRDTYGLNISLFITSLVFGLIHIPAAGGLHAPAALYVITTFTLGLLLGYIYEEQKSIIIPIVAHGVYNSILLVGYYVYMINMI